MIHRASISAFFPAFNDDGTIASMVVETDRVLKSVTDDYEIIVVNDGSMDSTQEVLEELTNFYPALSILRHEKNMGYGAALISGFVNSTKDYIFYTDGDAQYDVRELTVLLEALEENTSVVNGYKITRSDPLHRIIIGHIYNRVVKLLFNIKLKDVDCDYRLIKRSVFEKIRLKSPSGIICVELIKKLESSGFKFKEVPVHHYFRTHGKSQFFNFRRVFAVGVGLIRLWVELVLLRKEFGVKQVRTAI